MDSRLPKESKTEHKGPLDDDGEKESKFTLEAQDGFTTQVRIWLSAYINKKPKLSIDEVWFTDFVLFVWVK